jgi:hypothetical protein
LPILLVRLLEFFTFLPLFRCHRNAAVSGHVRERRRQTEGALGLVPCLAACRFLARPLSRSADARVSETPRGKRTAAMTPSYGGFRATRYLGLGFPTRE